MQILLHPREKLQAPISSSQPAPPHRASPLLSLFFADSGLPALTVFYRPFPVPSFQNYSVVFYYSFLPSILTSLSTLSLNTANFRSFSCMPGVLAFTGNSYYHASCNRSTGFTIKTTRPFPSSVEPDIPGMLAN